MGVVKADGYGHGALQVSGVLVRQGVDYLAVATIEEALELRQEYEIPILVLGYITPNQISTAIKNNISLTIYNNDIANEIEKHAMDINKTATVHIKVDSGMTRLGFLNTQYDDIARIFNKKNIMVEGIYTHFSCADCDEKYTYMQYEQFINICNRLDQIYEIKYKHCCNSAAILKFPNMHLNMVRAGIILYGLTPFSDNQNYNYKLISAMSLKTKIIDIKKVRTGTKISYSGNYVTQKDSIIGIIPIGYGDGLIRGLSNNANVLINGEFAPVVGNICMDQCMIDITHIPNTKLYDEVTIIGIDGKKGISTDDIAKRLDTINYEIVCSFNKRIPRIYK